MFNLSNLGIPIIQAPMAGGINNVFIRLMEGKMVLPFPRQNSMTASLRQLGGGRTNNGEYQSLWTGQGYALQFFTCKQRWSGNDNSGRPGSLRDNLALVDSRALPTSEQWLSIRLTNEKMLTRQTRYWIQVTATGPAGSMAYSREHSGQSVATESYLNMYGFHRNTETGPYIFKLVALEKNP